MYQLEFKWLLLLLVLPVLLWFWRRRKFAQPFLTYSLSHRLKELHSPVTKLWLQFHQLLPYIALILIIVALARPQKLEKESQVLSEGIDLILAIDVSESMAALDFQLNGERVNRLSVVKKVVKDFIKKQVGNRLGMVLFGEAAYTQSPITLDYEVLKQLLEQAKIGMAGNGTAVGEGLALSVKRLKDLESKSKVVILLTDGRNNSGKISPEKAAQIAKTFNIKVYTIGIGTVGKVPFPRQTPFGTRMIYVELDLDQEALEKIANITGGRYFYAGDTERLKEIYEEINQMEKTEVEVKHYEHTEELFYYFVLASFVCWFWYWLASVTYVKRVF